jgi:hypothetical protein
MDAESAMAIDAAVATLTAAMAPHDSGRTFGNFADRPTAPERVYGDRLEALRAVKARVDAQDLFAANYGLA